MITRTLTLVLLTGLNGMVMGQADLSFQDFKQGQQVGPYNAIFQYGEVNVRLQDGEIYVAGCGGTPSPAIIPPNITCPLGTTGFIVQGDVGGGGADGLEPDGIPDDGSFWSVSSIIPAAVVEPFRVDLFTITAAPPSGLATILRGNDGDIRSVFSIADESVVTYYDYINFPIEEFKVTLFTMQRLYGQRGNQWVTAEGDLVSEPLAEPLPDLATLRPNSLFWPTDSTTLNTFFAPDLPAGTDPLVTPALRENTVVRPDAPYRFNMGTNRRLEEELQRQYTDVPWGTYIFSAPALDNPEQGQVFGVTMQVSPDIYPGRGGVPAGWRINNDDDWFMGRMEVDPRLFYEFFWQGIEFQNTVTSDELYFGMRSNHYLVDPLLATAVASIDTTPDPELVPPGSPVLEDVWVFPPYQFDTPVGDREPFKLGVYDGSYELGPYFFQPGESVTGELDWRRNIEGGAATRDISQRILDFDINFIDTFPGFAFYSRSPQLPDGFLFGTPTSERQPLLDKDGDGFNNLIEYALLSDLEDITKMPVIEPVPGVDPAVCSGMITKRKYVGSSLIYQMEYSSDGVVWETILPGGDWDITQTDTELAVVSNVPIPSGTMCMLRAKVTMNP